MQLYEESGDETPGMEPSPRTVVLAAVTEHGPVGPKEIADRTGVEYNYVKSLVRRLDEDGSIVRLDHGVYVQKDHPDAKGLRNGSSGHTLGDGPHQDAVPRNYQIVHIPEIDIEPAAGEGAAVGHYDEKLVNGELRLPSWYIRSEYGVSPESIFQVRVRGTSMTPTLQPGQRLLVSKWPAGRPIQDGLVYVFIGPGGLQIKRLFIEEESSSDTTYTYVKVWSDNEEAPRYRVSSTRWDDAYRVVAVALEINTKL